MFSLTGFLLIIKFVLAELRFDPHVECDFYTKLTCQNVTLYNPQWPAAYAPGMMCRWIYDCPIWHSCLLQCRDLGLPQTRGCYMDKLLVSQSGDPYFSDAQIYCGRDIINYKSVGSKIVIALITHPLSPGGRFICTLRAELWSVTQNRTIFAQQNKMKKTHRKKAKKKKEHTRLASAPQVDSNLPKITRIEHGNDKQKIIQHSNHTKIDHGEYIHAKLKHGKFINTISQANKHKPKKSKQEKQQHAKQCGLHVNISSQTEMRDSTESTKEIDEQTESSTHKQIKTQNKRQKQTKRQQEKRICKQMESKTKHKQTKSNYKRFAKAKSYGRCEEIDPLYEDQQAESLIETQRIDFPNRKQSQYETYKPSKLHHESAEQVGLQDTEYKEAESAYREPELAEPMFRLLEVTEPQNVDLEHTKTPQINSYTGAQAQAESQIRETRVEVSEPTELLKEKNDECATTQQGMLQTNSQHKQSKSQYKKKRHKKMRHTEKEKQDQGRLMFKWNLINDLMKKMQIHAEVTYEGHETSTSKTAQKVVKLTPSPEIKRLQEKLSNLVAKSFKSAKGSPKHASINFKYVKKVIKVVRSVKRRRTARQKTKEDIDKHNTSVVIF